MSLLFPFFEQFILLIFDRRLQSFVLLCQGLDLVHIILYLFCLLVELTIVGNLKLFKLFLVVNKQLFLLLFQFFQIS